MYMLNDTICAISTALKDGAISIVRMSGDDSFSIIREISDIKKIEPNTIVYSHIRDEGEIIDEVLISFFEKGRSYTFEDMVEINCHGGVYVTRLILNLLLKKGCPNQANSPREPTLMAGSIFRLLIPSMI